ncbi:MAG: D-alanine--D-alanine ligase [Elusimicrobia bacterium]|nr:D-alanine--D-alanine ligase [Elusimicrobiota bacterium]
MKQFRPPDGCVPPRGGRRLRVAVLYGGQSAEHDVSLASAKTVMENLSPERYEVVGIRIDRRGRWLLENDGRRGEKAMLPFGGLGPCRLARGERGGAAPLGVDVVFPVLHGSMGEDGTVQGMLELAHVPYVGCGVLASAVGMDKDVAKRLALQSGIPVLPHVLLRSAADLAAKTPLIRRLKLPVFVKPVCLGSSIGVRKVKAWGEVRGAVRHAFLYDTKVMVEQGVEGQEICCAVLGKPGSVKTSGCGEVVVTGKHEFFDYSAKYFDEQGHEFLIPARLAADEEGRLRDLAARVFESFEGYGMARVDFFMDRGSRRAFFGEINTIPGFTGHSLYPALFKAAGLSIKDLVDRLVALALERSRERAGLRLSPR